MPFSRTSGLGYDLSIDGVHTYLVGPTEVLVHNCSREPLSSLGGGSKSAIQRALLARQLVAEQIAGGHAFSKHVLDQRQFAGIRTTKQFANEIESVIANPTFRKRFDGYKTAYYFAPQDTIVILDPRNPDGGTAFKPGGVGYFNKLRSLGLPNGIHAQ